MIEILNAMKTDFAVLGNHEFDFGSDVLRQRMQEATFTWLGSNVRETNGNLFENVCDVHVLQVKSFKVGFFGICTSETPKLSYPGEDVVFGDIIPCAAVCQQNILYYVLGFFI